MFVQNPGRNYVYNLSFLILCLSLSLRAAIGIAIDGNDSRDIRVLAISIQKRALRVTPSRICDINVMIFPCVDGRCIASMEETELSYSSAILEIEYH